MMKYRVLGRTGIKVSEVGYGAWGIGGELWSGSRDDESMKALRTAVDEGLNFIDTALAYGNGHSERLISKLLKEHPGKLSVSTKIPPKNGQWPAAPNSKLRDVFPHKYIIECVEKSLKNLAVDRLDIEQFHVWNDDWANDNEWWDAIQSLKEQEKIRFVGISINDHQPENAIETGKTGRIDSYQVIFNIFDQSPIRKLFPFCQKENIGIIVRVPFDEGSLTGSITLDTKFPPSDFRHKYFTDERKKEVVRRVAKLKDFLGKEAATLPELALRFCLSFPPVSTIIPGMRTSRNVLANCAVSDGRFLSPSLLEELREHAWDRNFYD